MAWFRVREELDVSQMNLGINGEYDFEIGMRNGSTIEYYDHIDNDTLKSHFPSYHPETGIQDVSSMYSSLWLNDGTASDLKWPEFRTNLGTAANKKTGALAHSGYFQFEFFIRSSAGGYLFLSENTWVKAEHQTNVEKAKALNEAWDDKKEVTAEDLDKVVDTARFSFYTDLGYTIYEPGYTGEKTKFAGLLDMTPADSFYDTDSDNKEILYGEYNDDATIYYGEALEEDVPVVGSRTSFNAGHKAGTQPVDFEKSLGEGNLQIAEEESYGLDGLTFDSRYPSYDPSSMHALGYCEKNQPMRLVVSLYLEGWDRDLTDVISEGTFSANLAFTMLHSPKI